MQKLLDKTNTKNLAEQITKLSSGKVLVIGDIILDEFLIGSPERISREAPVIILEHISSQFALGGASNAAHNISSYGAKSFLVGVVGDDMYSEAIENECLKREIVPALVVDKERPTTVKTRILSMSHKHPTSSIQFKQQLLRLDRLSRDKLSSKIEKETINKFDTFINQANAVLISDYELGLCSKDLIDHVINNSNKLNKPVIVDAPYNFQRFKGSYMITPNQPDTEHTVGFSIKTDDDLIKAGQKLLDISGTENILITRGSEGMALFDGSNPEKPFILPAFNVSEVFDVTGAGDTVAGTIACALSVKCPKESACIISNLAASKVVKKYGTSVTTTHELIGYLKEL
ncbi:MAG: bifunctional hydroxymethylpyrimidine kinase/phosphomethylpyrimidine kinase [Candidatus Melainabacteria bacterium]|nr:bifunctional hydroxymethylpyrimidine kinase/phosphomethylpyrimidine kinase [Candidatus Melainabacteria bacterium]